MSGEQLQELLTLVKEKYSQLPRNQEHLYIKYIMFYYDTRDNDIYKIAFRPWFQSDMVYVETVTEEDIRLMYEWLNKKIKEIPVKKFNLG